MLPDYPKMKKYLEKRFSDAIKDEIQKDPLLSTLKVRKVHEGDVLVSSSVEGFSERIEYKEISAKFEIKNEEIIEKGPDAYFSRVKQIAKEIGGQQSQIFIKKMDEVTQRTGNVVNAKARPLSPQLILEALEKIAFDFDEHGNPIFPSLVVSPQQYEKIKKEIPKWESDPDLRTKHTELIEKKRKEWLDRESNRKLAD
jgi:hypothetical protein